MRRAILVLTLALAVLSGASSRAHAGPSDGLVPTLALLDRSTPRRALQGFLDAAHAGDFLRAAHYLDLRSVARADQAGEGPLLARELAFVIDGNLPIDGAKLSDDPKSAADGAAVGAIDLDGELVPVTLTRVRFDDGVQRWVVSRTTVAMVPALWEEFGTRGWEDRIPEPLVRRRLLGTEAWKWLALLAATIAAWLLATIVAALTIGLAKRLAARTRTPWDERLIEAARRPLRLVVAVVAVRLSLDPLRLAGALTTGIERVTHTLLVVGVAWFIIRALGVGSAWIAARIPENPQDELATRGLRTQLLVMQRVASVIVTVVAVAVVLIQFDFVRSVGVSLLASAGVAGIVLGFAAQKSLSGVIAGIQISITQPVRIGDTVVIEGENGSIEEINLTYVVVRIWDGRRLVVPIARFLDQPFQNWTKVSPELLGVVLVQVDFRTPVDQVRAELQRIVESSERWDRRVCKLEVTEASSQAITLRAVVSAADADLCWDLRCEVRERLLAHLRELDGGAYLPRAREESLHHVAPELAAATKGE